MPTKAIKRNKKLNKSKQNDVGIGLDVKASRDNGNGFFLDDGDNETVGTASSIRRRMLSSKARKGHLRQFGEGTSSSSRNLFSASCKFESASSKENIECPQKERRKHLVCAISENLARETCLTCIDACLPTELHVTKQGNGNTYGETLQALDWIQPHEILLNEGRIKSQLMQKIISIYDPPNDEGSSDEDDQVLNSSKSRSKKKNKATRFRLNLGKETDFKTVVKLVPRHYFDQTKGSELLRSICRADQQHNANSPVMEEYILLASAHAAVHYASVCLGVLFAPKSVLLHMNNPQGSSLSTSYFCNRVCIDRSTLMQLELLANARTGNNKNSLVGTIDCTKTSVGHRLLRRTLMAPPNRLSTIETRLDMVQSLLADEDFFYQVMDHLEALPELDRMMSHMALVPKVPMHQRKRSKQDVGPVVTDKMANRGISALVCIKTTLSVIPTFADALQSKIELMQSTQVDLQSDIRSQDKNDEEDSQGGGNQVENSQEDETGIDSSCIMDDDGTVTTGFFTSMGELTVLSTPAASKKRCSKTSVRQETKNRKTHPVKSLLLRAILQNMRQPALKEILDAIDNIFTESTTYCRNSHAMRHQVCFALKPNTDGMMDILRKAFLANVDDIFRLADEYSEKFGMPVAVRENSTRGYFLSIPESHLNAGTLSPIFIQPVKYGRFIQCTTEEIHSLNSRAQENVRDLLLLTHSKIQEVMDIARARYESLASLCDAIALLDMLHSFADVVASSSLPWCRPIMKNKININQSSSSYAGGLAIRNGRYCINTMSGGFANKEFVPNDIFAGPFQNFTVITGVNGSGKSIYLKQIANIVILAHCGSYVPAEEAIIPIFDKILTRIGTSDDQEHNISTFMLEMRETAAICDQVTDKSLVLIDELGRATSNEDGVAIAWAVSEFLLVKRAITFFVTHYPQLTKLAEVYHNVQNQHLGTIALNNELQYTHKIQSGPCETSSDYGVEMAGTCGWPIDVVKDVSLSFWKL